MHAFDRLVQACQSTGSAVCAGLDLHLSELPPRLRSDGLAGCRTFLWAVLDALQGQVPVVKPQIAFFEQLGPPGIELYFDCIRESHRRGFLVIGDIKRGDIGSTAAAYAAAHLAPNDGSAADFVTLNPYMGFDGIEPFLETGRRTGRGVFVLARTSNPSAGELQDLSTGDVPLYLHVGRRIGEWGRLNLGVRGFGDAGAVVGATHPRELEVMRRGLKDVFFLVPGYGAQGGSAKDVTAAFTGENVGAVVNSSRSLLFAYKTAEGGERRFAECAREAARKMTLDLRSAWRARPSGVDL